MEELRSTIAVWLNEPSIARLSSIALGILLVFTLSFFLKKGLNKSIKSNDNKYRARKAVNFTGYFLILSIVLFVYSDKLGNIGVALGVAGAGIAFALQEVIVSFAGWVNIVVSGVVSVGDRVKIADVKGDVIDIGVMSTTIMEVGDWVDGDLYNGRIVTLANSFVFKEKVHNYSAEYPFLWDEITIPIRLESDYKLTRNVFLTAVTEICGDYATASSERWGQLAYKYRVEDAQVQPMVTLKFNENWITYTLRYIVDFKKRRSTKDLIYTRLLNEIANHSDKIMIGTSTLEVTNVVEKP